MKKSLLTLLLLGALGACSQSDNTKKSAEQSVEISATSSAHVNQKPNSDDAGIFNYKENLDIAKLGFALKEAGFAQAAQSGKEAEWHQGLKNAKNNNEIQAVLREQLALYRQGTEKLANLQMESTKGKAAHEKILGGLQGAQNILEQMTTLDLSSPEGTVKAIELMPQIQQHVQNLAQGVQMWMGMMKDNGFSLDQQAEEKFKEKMKELEQKVH